MLRLAALGLSHEANTFVDTKVDVASALAAGLLTGPEISARHVGGTSTMSGFLAAGAQTGIEVVPLVHLTLTPAGMLTEQALIVITEELTGALRAQGPFDGVLAALHGAAVAEHVWDVDGFLLRRFREAVGPNVPIGAALDLHANISPEMCAYADVINTYRTNPHVDAKETALEIAELVIRTARGEIRPTLAFQPIPVTINILCQNTGTPPMSDLLARARQLTAEPGVLSATIAEGYPYADVPEMGMSVVVITDDDRKAATRHARRLAEAVWSRRHEFDATATPVNQAIEHAMTAAGPVLLLDVGDNVGGGAPGDSVILLHAAREHGLASLLTIVVDPEAAAACHAVGVAGQLALRMGGRTADTGPPVEAVATVLALHSGEFEASIAVHAGMRHFDAGPSAAVRLDSGQTVILASRATLPLSVDQLTTLGLQPSQFRAIVAKGVHAPLAGYGPHVTEVVQVDTPGVTSADLRRFQYRHRRRPMLPFEADTSF